MYALYFYDIGYGVLYKTSKKSPIQTIGLSKLNSSIVTVDWMPNIMAQSMSYALTGSLDGTMNIWSLKDKSIDTFDNIM